MYLNLKTSWNESAEPQEHFEEALLEDLVLGFDHFPKDRILSPV